LKDEGLHVLEQAVLECAPRSGITRATGEAEEVLFVVSGVGILRLGDGETHALEPETGVNLGPGQDYELTAEGSDPLRTVCVRIPAPAPQVGGAPAPQVGGGPAPEVASDGGNARVVVRRLADQEAQNATTDRTFRIVADPSTGLRSATHFVGYVPTERAPDHFHTYDEVIYVLDGEGAFHAGGVSTPIRRGSTIELPARTVHCLENTGPDVMRLVAVFRPAGSPAAAYYPDGTPAYPGTPKLTTQPSSN
jgi:mannose-6-phosphate isomerase-like protein (cupin superfamily)